MKNLNSRKVAYILLATAVFLLLVSLSTYELLSFLPLLGKRLPPFLVTKQLGIDAVGMFLRPETFTKIIPQSYVKEANGVPVKNDKEFYEVIQSLPPDVKEIKIKLSNPFFFGEQEYYTEVGLYEIGYSDFFVSFLLPALLSVLMFSIAYYLLIVMVNNFESFSVYKKQMFLSSIVFFLSTGVLVVSFLDLINRKEFSPVMYASLGTINVVLSTLFYYLSYFRIRWWLYVVAANIFLSSLMLTGYFVFFNNPKFLISLVKVNYLIISLNIVGGAIYFSSVRKMVPNIIEKERIKLTTIVLFLPILVLGAMLLVQSMSTYSVPISIPFLTFIALSPVISVTITDHSVKVAREKILFSTTVGVVAIVGFAILSGDIINLPEESLFLFGVYGLPAVLFFLVVLWYSLENRSYGGTDLPEMGLLDKSNLRVYLFSKLKRRFKFIKDVKIILQYPIIYAEEVFTTYMSNSELWESVGGGEIITSNDVFFDRNLSKFDKVFRTYGVEYLFGFSMSSNKCLVGITTTRAINQRELEQISMTVNSFSIDLQSFAVINSVKFVKVINLEFELVRQSQMDLLKSNRSILVDTPNGKINIFNYWEPMVDLAGDIYGTTRSGAFLTSWISDICGKGFVAAAISFTCFTLINQIIKNNTYISKSARIINDLLVNEPLFSVENFFLTLSGITINTETMEAEVINCGNPPVIFFDGSKVIEINPKGGIIGIFDDLQVGTFNVKLEKGMVLLMFSDGITDIMDRESKRIDQVEYMKSIVSSHKTPEIMWENITQNLKNLSLHENTTDDIVLSMIYVS